MAVSSVPVQSIAPITLAQASVKPKAAKPMVNQSASQSTSQSIPSAAPPATNWWMYSTFGLSAILVVLGITSYFQSRKLQQLLDREKRRAHELKREVKVRSEVIVKMEKNPDLVNSRDFNLDYLRRRMGEEVFHYEIVNQIKNKVRDKISVALRPKQIANGQQGMPSNSGRQVDEIFDVEYKTDDLGTKRVLFRVGIRLVKLPTQPTSATIGQIIDCIETFLSPSQEHDSWQPTIQGRLAHLRWDQKAKPTPLLMLEQSQEGANVTFRTQRGLPQEKPAAR